MIRFFTGLASGLAIAYLTAPRPGKQLRNAVVDSTKQTVEKGQQIKNQWDVTATQVKELLRVVHVNTGLSLPNLLAKTQTNRFGTTKGRFLKKIT